MFWVINFMEQHGITATTLAVQRVDTISFLQSTHIKMNIFGSL